MAKTKPKPFKFTRSYLKKLKSADELILILKNLMWLQENMRWEVGLSKFRKEEYSEQLQQVIVIITEQLLTDIKENVEEKEKFNKADGT